MLLMSSHLYILCQALDLRALQHELLQGLDKIISQELAASFPHFTPNLWKSLESDILAASRHAFDKANTMDGEDRIRETASAGLRHILKATMTHLQGPEQASVGPSLQEFESNVSRRGYELLQNLRREYLSGDRGPAPASSYVGATKVVYQYVREGLGIRMHGRENLDCFADGLNFVDQTIGQNVSLIYEVRSSHSSLLKENPFLIVFMCLVYERWASTNHYRRFDDESCGCAPYERRERSRKRRALSAFVRNLPFYSYLC